MRTYRHGAVSKLGVIGVRVPRRGRRDVALGVAFPVASVADHNVHLLHFGRHNNKKAIKCICRHTTNGVCSRIVDHRRRHTHKNFTYARAHAQEQNRDVGSAHSCA